MLFHLWNIKPEWKICYYLYVKITVPWWFCYTFPRFSRSVKDFTNPSHRFKVETNSNQLFMTGVVALNHDCNVVVVEGGPKQQNRMKRLMLHRIKWLENKRGVVDPSKTEPNSDPCTLIWEVGVARFLYLLWWLSWSLHIVALYHRMPKQYRPAWW